MTLTSHLIAEQIAGVARSFASNELAFLSLTSKIERPFLDRLAFALFSIFGDAGWFVAREWPLPGGRGRVDIAVLNGESAHTLLEGKAMVSFDCTRDGSKQSEYPRLVQKDLDRLAGTPLPGAQVFCLLLASHPLNPIPTSARNVFKYTRDINRAFDRFGSAPRVREVCDTNLRRYLVPSMSIVDGCVPGGCAYGVRVELLWWLMGPFTTTGDLRILREPPSNTAMQRTRARMASHRASAGGTGR